MIPSIEDDRVRRRDRASIATGAGLGAGLGAIGGALGAPLGLVLAGALAGALIGKLVALRLSPDEWDPSSTRRPYVGTSSPDDDITTT